MFEHGWSEPRRRPLVFLDVDGTLLPVGGAQTPLGIDEWDAWQGTGNPQLAKIDRAYGPRLLALPCELVWATAWMHDANEVISPLLGLPQLPVAGLPDDPDQYDYEIGAVLHWKTRALVEMAAGRPFAWVDDEIGEPDHAWVAEHHRGPALLHRVDSGPGLTAADFAVLEGWLREVNGA
jgi:hypothetical protein